MDTNTIPNEGTATRWNVLSFFNGRRKSAPKSAEDIHPEPTVPAEAPRILVVDDDEVIRQTTARKLKAHGYNVCTAADGSSAIHAARSERPDLILLDLNFPPDVSLTWDGFSILSWLRRLEETRNIPVIIVTGEQTNNLGQRAQAAGAVGCLNKPLDFHPLIALIELRLKTAAAAGCSPAVGQCKD